MININDQCGKRKIKLDLKLDETASGGEQGLIKVCRAKNGQVIFEMASNRTSKVEIEQMIRDDSSDSDPEYFKK